MDLTSFARIPIVDAHVHFAHPERMDEILALLKAAGCRDANLVCIPERDASTHNPLALAFKQRYPDRIYISGALDYTPLLADPNSAPAALGEHVRALKARGFDGLKLIEGKPEVRKLLPYPLDGPLYARMWAALEEERFPVVFHAADPDEFWDPKRCPGWARQNGWDYSDGNYPSKEALYTEVENILARHLELRITFAHFYFLSADLERAGRFLEAHPTVCFDLAPHLEMYADFSRNQPEARDFFLRFQDRILYGTDLDTRALARGGEGAGLMRFIPWLIRSMLEREGEFFTSGGERYCGLGLPAEALEKIYHTNFQRVYGSAPAPLREQQ